MKCRWCHVCAKDNLKNNIPEHLEEILPEGHCHFICSFISLESGFTAYVKLQLGTREAAQTWLENFQQSSKITLRVDKTYPITEDTVRRNSYRVDMRCQHNTRQPHFTQKNTHCPAGLYVVLKKSQHSQKRKSRSSDSHIQEGLLLYVTIKHHHNHCLTCVEALQHRDVARETKEKLEKLFQSGHSPSSALNTLKCDLQQEQGDSYMNASADRSICPDIHFCYRLYSIFKREYGAASRDALIKNIQERLEIYNQEQNETCAQMETTTDGQTVIAVCTPVMKRIHRLERHSGEMVFIDSSGNCDRMNSRIFLLLTHSAAGGLPLGVVITTSESQNTITAGLKLLLSVLPEDAFYGRGELGPKVVMTNDCKALRQALEDVFSQTTPLVCVFHVLQAMWRWLWDSHHGVQKEDRQWLLDVFKQLVFAISPEELGTSYHQALQDPVVLKHQMYQDRLTAVFARRRDWAICLHAGLPIRGNSSFVESAMRILKDGIFHRLKAYNITQVVDFICTRLEAYYIRRLLDVANQRTVKRDFKCSSVSPDRIVKEDESNYSVPSEKGVHLVNVTMGTCTCPAGSSGVLCKHQYSVMQAFKLQEGHHHPVTSFMEKKILYEMATGTPEQRGKDTTLQDYSGGEEESVAGTEHLEGRLRSMFDGLMDKLRKDETFKAPVESFVFSYEKIHTDSRLISALSAFGEVRNVAAARNIKRQPRRSLQIRTQLGVQPTVISGRPSKRPRRERHYGCFKEGSGALPRRQAPHSLAHCVSTGEVMV